MSKFSLGVFGGGFKPFTLGHFSMLALAAQENDKAVLLYGISGRKTQNSDYNYSQEMAKEIFKISKSAIEREMKNVTVIEANPPLSSVFGIIESVKGVRFPKIDPLSDLKIDPQEIISLKVYDGPDDILRYKRYISEDKPYYYGDLIETKRLQFDSGHGEARGSAGMIKTVKKWCEDKRDISNVQSVRGTIIRKMIADGTDIKEFEKNMPPIYSKDELNRIFEIMKQGIVKKQPILTNKISIMVG